MIESILIKLTDLLEPVREHFSVFSQICLIVSAIFFMAYLPWRKKEFALLGSVALVYGLAQFMV